MPAFDYAIFFACAAGLVITLYVTLDGFDLGVGILFPFAPKKFDRDIMMATLAPTWDGNETWLVLGGMVLLAGFPLAFSILLPAFYVPLCIMLLGLVLRGVAFEFRSQGGVLQFAWSAAFAGGSVIAAFCQGAILGAFVDESIVVTGRSFGGGPFDWLHLFPIATGLGVIAGYAVLGSGWLIWRTSGSTQVFAREIARPALLATAAALVGVSVWTPLALPSIAERWFAWPRIAGLSLLPIIALAAWLTAWRGLWSERHWLPLAASVLLFVCALAGIGVSVWPAAIPGALTIWEASSDPHTQAIVAPALIAIVPIIVAYVAFSYWVFRGKVTGSDAGYGGSIR
jgi:cytochrome bd ubiquinol oxidase subunit II